jgi:hypothetical protein
MPSPSLPGNLFKQPNGQYATESCYGRMRDPFPTPCHISALIIELIQGQINFVGHAQWVLVGTDKEFRGVIYGVMMRRTVMASRETHPGAYPTQVAWTPEIGPRSRAGAHRPP